MSRVPSYGHQPPPGQVYYHHQPPPAPPPHSSMMQPPPPPPQAYTHDPMYQQQYAREPPPPPPQQAQANRPMWNSVPPPEDYGNAAAGPSRGDMSAPYGYRTSPTHQTSATRHPPGSSGGGPGWSSIHPSAPAPVPAQPQQAQVNAPMPSSARMESGRGSVKLEDLVSHDRKNAAASSQQHPKEDAPKNTRRQSGPGDGGNAGSGPSEFIKKLYRMLEDESAQYGKARNQGKHKRGSVGWGKGGTSFVVWDMNDFTTKILPQTFRHSNFSSFVRQLNKYGFSKIKHVDEESGQIKENVWEFQHPSFQTGGKADLESIKRKAVAPKKPAGEGDVEASPSKPGMSAEDAGRLSEMEQRVRLLEDKLAKAVDELQEVRYRENGAMNLIREVIGHLATTEKDTGASPAAVPSSSRVANLFRMFDQVASGRPSRTAVSNGQFHATTFQTPGAPFGGGTAAASPMTDGASDGPSPAPSRGSVHGRPVSRDHRPADNTQDDPMDPQSLLQAANQQAAQLQAQVQQAQSDAQAQAQAGAQAGQGGAQPNNAGDATLYNGEPMSMTPVFADTPAWLTENTPLPPYNRKASDATTLRLMVEALSSQNPAEAARFDEIPSEPLQPVPENPNPVQVEQPQPASISIIPPQANGTAAPESVQQNQNQNQNQNQTQPQTQNQHANGNQVNPPPSLGQLFPLPVPPEASSSSSPDNTKDTTVSRRSKIQPHWTTSPRILVVEDDVVYRQLSAKFLDKFGCVTETVEDAQGAVSKMNQRKYDLVLMDIFFGPSMDGRKATSLIRQFDMYTPIISMTSNVQTHDVNSYLQSGMNDVLAKPFTKHGLFGILDKHLIHLKAIQLSAEVPRSLGLPPLSDEGVQDAVQTGASQWVSTDATNLRNPLAAMGWSDETYQLVLQQFMATGTMPEVSTITNGTIGTSVVFGNAANFRKRSIETLDDDWNAVTGASGSGTTNAGSVMGNIDPNVAGVTGVNGAQMQMGGGGGGGGVGVSGTTMPGSAMGGGAMPDMTNQGMGMNGMTALSSQGGQAPQGMDGQTTSLGMMAPQSQTQQGNASVGGAVGLGVGGMPMTNGASSGGGGSRSNKKMKKAQA